MTSQLAEYCTKYGRLITVAAIVDGKMTMVALADLPISEQARQIARWDREGVIPRRYYLEGETIPHEEIKEE